MTLIISVSISGILDQAPVSTFCLLPLCGGDKLALMILSSIEVLTGPLPWAEGIGSSSAYQGF